MEILRTDWDGREELRQRIMRDPAYYGNDNDGADLIAVRLLDDFADCCYALNGRCGYRFPAGVSTFGRQLDWLPKRLASPHGHKKGDILAGNCSPTPGTDWGGATAIIRSYCKLHLRRTVSGAALDVRLLPQTVKGQSGLDGLMSLLRGFVTLGGFFMQIDVADAQLLREASEHPEQYPTLSVRVSGWNARFITMSKQWQQMVIEQNEHGSV